MKEAADQGGLGCVISATVRDNREQTGMAGCDAGDRLYDGEEPPAINQRSMTAGDGYGMRRVAKWPAQQQLRTLPPLQQQDRAPPPKFCVASSPTCGHIKF